jgi:hypothetical protein
MALGPCSGKDAEEKMAHLTLRRSQEPGWAPMAHTYNPGYSGCTEQEDHGSKPAQANSSRDPISKNPTHKKKDW